MSIRALLRGAAVLIAVLGMVDPAISLARRVRQPLVIAIDETLQAAETSAATLHELLRDDYDVRVRRIGDAERAPACAQKEPCVLVGGDRWPGRLRDVPSSADAGSADSQPRVIGLLRVDSPPGPHVAIRKVTAETSTHVSAVGHLLVGLEGRNVAGQHSLVEVFDGDVPIGRAEHAWSADGDATVPIEWWPIGGELRRLSVRASRIDTGGLHTDALVDVGVDVATVPHNVLVYDTRPSWTSTFVRRAIERDDRVALRVLARLGPRLQVTAGEPFRLDDASLAEASAVVIGAPDGLTAREVDALGRFVRVRGGSLVLVPDQRLEGPIVRLLQDVMPPARSMTERLEPSPVRAGDWRASELLVFRDLPPAVVTLATAGGDPVVIAIPSGNGRIIVSGLMDAWRYRDADDAAFDRAWQSLVADASAAGGRPLDVTLDRSLVRPGDDVHVTVHLRAMSPPDAAASVGSTLTCGDDPPRLVRLWPTGDRRRFEGRFAASAVGSCRVAVSSSAPIAANATADLLVAADFHRGANFHKGADPFNEIATMEQISQASGVRIAAAGDESTMARDLRRLAPSTMAPTAVRPMRSPWWIVPFAGCLGAEWWLRRRQGLPQLR